MQNNQEYRRWKKFWAEQSTPLHRHNTVEWYQLYANEINLLLDSLQYDQGAVLETGCGNGALFDFLRIHKENYTGVDASEKLLDIFRASHPELELICSDASTFLSQQKYSLIFSNGVVQYFNKKMMDSYIRNSALMLSKGGILLMINIPFKDLKWKFYAGELSETLDGYSKFKVLKSSLRGFVRGDSLGHWYNPRDFLRFQQLGLDVYVFGSLFHPYRFSIAMRIMK